MESGILNKLLFVLCWFSVITLDDLNITETCPGPYHYCSRIKCCVNFMVIKDTISLIVWITAQFL